MRNEQRKNQNKLTDEHLDKIVRAYQTRKRIEKYAHAASLKEIKENDFNLNIPRYVDTFEEEEDIDIDAVQRDIDQLEQELAEVRRKMDTMLKELRKGKEKTERKCQKIVHFNFYLLKNYCL